MSVRADAETLRQIPIFAECEAMHLQLLAFAAERHDFVAGETILKQGEKAVSAFLILSGHAELTEVSGYQIRKIAKAEPGSLLGEVAMIGQSNYAISATAATAVATARIDYPLFFRVVREYPGFGQNVFRSLSRKLEFSLHELDIVRNQFNRSRAFSDL